MKTDQFKEIVLNKREHKKIGSYFISFLDDFLGGIFDDDLVLIGASSGVGKSELAYQIAFGNCKKLRVHLFALEADYNEPYLRMMYKILVREYYKDIKENKDVPRIEDIRYRTWVDNTINLDKYLRIAKEEMEESYNTITIHYRGSNFNISDFLKRIDEIKDDCDLIVLDHIDYFDLEGNENENSGMTKIMKVLREINKDKHMPMILISHLRKQSNRKQIIPDLDDFIGSSNKPKQVKTAILVSKDTATEDHSVGDFGTFIRIPKGRKGASGNVVARLLYNTRMEKYKTDYELCYIKNYGEAVGDIDAERLPRWAKHVRKKVDYGQPKF